MYYVVVDEGYAIVATCKDMYVMIDVVCVAEW